MSEGERERYRETNSDREREGRRETMRKRERGDVQTQTSEEQA